MALSFKTDIAPFLAPYRDNMLWRFDLAAYEAVKANADLIYGVIEPGSGNPMPPPPLPPIDAGDVAKFKTWMDDACPP